MFSMSESMQSQFDYVLAERLARLAGRFGAYGTRFVGLRLPVNRATRTMTVWSDPDSVSRVLRGVLADAGEIIAWSQEAETNLAIGAVVGTGRRGLNPALAVGTVQAAPDGNAVVTLAGYAKEGLIKQRGGEEAAERLLSLLEVRLGQGGLKFVVSSEAPPN